MIHLNGKMNNANIIWMYHLGEACKWIIWMEMTDDETNSSLYLNFHFLDFSKVKILDDYNMQFESFKTNLFM